MVYLIFGGNSYVALNKISELKKAFLKKTGDGVIVSDFNEEELARRPREILSQLFQDSLFSKRKLVILRSASAAPIFFELVKESSELFKISQNIFIFLEGAAAKGKEGEALKILKSISEKTQEAKILSESELDKWLQKKAGELGLNLSKEEREIMIAESGDGAEWALENELEKRFLEGWWQPRGQVLQDLAQRDGASRAIPQQRDMRVLAKSGAEAKAPSPFGFVEKIFSASLGRALLALKEAEATGQNLERFIYPLLWKAKQKKIPDAYFSGILAESAMRRNPKNAYEILERFILAIKA